MLKDLANKIGELGDGKLVQLLEKVLNEMNADILALNKAQLEKGQKADGTFTEPYSQRTVNQRLIEGNPVKGDLIALWDTGDFWDSFWSYARNGELVIAANDWKTEMLVRDYGETIFGLTDENFKALGEKVIPILKTEVYNFLRT